jgi:hypothetical protein
MTADEKNQFRRKFPRRLFQRLVGVLCAGRYYIFETGEIGEGGMSIVTDQALPQGQQLVLSFQIPNGDFVSLKGFVKSIKNEKGRFSHGLAFEDVTFTHRRQIRSFVSARSAHEEVA